MLKKARGHPQRARWAAGEQIVRHAARKGALEEIPTAFSGAAPVMKRATISSVVARCQVVFEAAGSYK